MPAPGHCAAAAPWVPACSLQAGSASSPGSLRMGSALRPRGPLLGTGCHGWRWDCGTCVSTGEGACQGPYPGHRETLPATRKAGEGVAGSQGPSAATHRPAHLAGPEVMRTGTPRALCPAKCPPHPPAPAPAHTPGPLPGTCFSGPSTQRRVCPLNFNRTPPSPPHPLQVHRSQPALLPALGPGGGGGGVGGQGPHPSAQA